MFQYIAVTIISASIAVGVGMLAFKYIEALFQTIIEALNIL